MVRERRKRIRRNGEIMVGGFGGLVVGKIIFCY